MDNLTLYLIGLIIAIIVGGYLVKKYT